MPGWAGSSFYWMRYMDAHNEKEFAKRSISLLKALIYTLAVTNMQLDIYCIPVLEQILKDKGFAPTEEPFKKTESGNDLGLVLCL
jgi:leucyl-tRNA synthetase